MTSTSPPVSTVHDAYPLRMVAAMSGLSPDIIRAWEKRYAVVAPTRGPRGARLYSSADVAKLRTLGEVVAAGRSIGDVAHLSHEDLLALVATRPPHSSASAEPSRPPTARLVEALVEAAARLDLAEFERHLSHGLIALGSRVCIDEVLLPVLQTIGDRWENGDMSISQEHFASSSIRNLLIGLLHRHASVVGTPLLLATPPGERHEFGLLVTALAAGEFGIPVRNLGPDLPADEIAAAARQMNCRVVGLGIVDSANRKNAVQSVRRIDSLVSPTIEIWLGGSDAAAVHAAAHVPRAKVIANSADLQSQLERLRVSMLLPTLSPTVGNRME